MSGAGGPQAEVRVLFVCLGNICRSPTAEGVMRSLLVEEGMEGSVAVDSAGTGAWHVGEPPDARARAAAAAQGIELGGTARQVRAADFDDFDLLVAMDRANQRDLLGVAPDEQARARVRLLREFDDASVQAGELDVPDPYYGGGTASSTSEHFDEVLGIVQAGCAGLLAEIREGRVP